MTPTTEELKALLKKATPGPWSEEPEPDLGKTFIVNLRKWVHIATVDAENATDHANSKLIALAPTLAARVVALEEVVKAAREAIAEIDDKVSWEINPSNYDHDNVCNMNSDWCEIGNIAQAARAKLEDRG